MTLNSILCSRVSLEAIGLDSPYPLATTWEAGTPAATRYFVTDSALLRDNDLLWAAGPVYLNDLKPLAQALISKVLIPIHTLSGHDYKKHFANVHRLDDKEECRF